MPDCPIGRLGHGLWALHFRGPATTNQNNNYLTLKENRAFSYWFRKIETMHETKTLHRRFYKASISSHRWTRATRCIRRWFAMGSLGFPGLGDSAGFNPALLESFQYNSFLLPRDGMLARYSMSSCVCPSGVRPSVCLSVINRYCIEASRRIELVFAWRFPSTYSIVLWGNSGVSRNKGTALWSFVQNSGA